MKKVRNIYLPDSDTHFADGLVGSPLVDGYGTYQLKKWLLALEKIPGDRRKLALDIGAHVGLWTMQMSKVFDVIHCYEPVPAHIECFVKNVIEVPKGKAQVHLHTFALGNAHGVTRINPVADNTGNAKIELGESKADTIFTTMRRLDEEVFVEGRLDFIKIDVEGYEYEVIQGGMMRIRRDKPVMVIEQKPGHGKTFGVTDTAAVELVKGWGAVVAWERAGDFCLTWP